MSEKWYDTNPDSPRFVDSVVELLMETHQDDAHFYALEQLIQAEGRGLVDDVNMWRAVLNKLDKEK